MATLLFIISILKYTEVCLQFNVKPPTYICIICFHFFINANMVFFFGIGEEEIIFNPPKSP